jgi:solute carrier family 25 citrate transporter 1
VRAEKKKGEGHAGLTCDKKTTDTIKVRMQLSKRGRQPGMPKRGFVATGAEIVRKETPLGLYKGLGAVLTGIVPKMAIRFTSFETYKQLLANKETGKVSGQALFFAGLAAGVTEAVAVVTPMEVVKIRLQAQHHSMADPLDVPKYRNAAHALYTIVKEEGAGALYRGVSLTALRQGSNQAVNFTAYTYFKEWLYQWQPEYQGGSLPSYQTTLIGLVSGAMGPLSNAPIDTIKTRLQKMKAEEGTTALQRITRIAGDMFRLVLLRPFSSYPFFRHRQTLTHPTPHNRQEGVHAFYKGITPRIMRVAPGQAVTFTVYEFLKERLERSGPAAITGGRYEE